MSRGIVNTIIDPVRSRTAGTPILCPARIRPLDRCAKHREPMTDLSWSRQNKSNKSQNNPCKFFETGVETDRTHGTSGFALGSLGKNKKSER
jgi:hypothetical protein